MDVHPPLVADRQVPIPGESGQRPLDHPSNAAQALARLDCKALHQCDVKNAKVPVAG